jgi:hypothetical protein
MADVIPRRALDVHAGSEKILAVADPIHDGFIWRINRVDEGKCRRAVHLYTFLNVE